jgi:bis(5'-nucleosyl)-tetraphosphatase (symmetrical)
MATFAIGDVHGCYRELRKLLEVMPMDWDRDRLWLVGDLVNRGPDSLRVLRWARRTSKEMGERFQVVLGNHDLRLLAMAEGLVRPKPWDTALEVLESRHRDKLLRWLAKQPLVYRRSDYLLVHGGLWPHWTAKAAEKWARRVEDALRRGKGKARQLLDPSVDPSEMSDSTAELNHALEAFTRLRSCTHKGKPCNHNGPAVALPKGCMPWFEVPGRRSADVTVVCGHWAALGLRVQEGLFALDTGCVWGGALTAIRLGEPAVYSQRAL